MFDEKAVDEQEVIVRERFMALNKRYRDKYHDGGVIVINSDADGDGGRYHIEMNAGNVFLYRVLPTGMLYIARVNFDGPVELFGDDMVLTAKRAISIVTTLLDDFGKINLTT